MPRQDVKTYMRNGKVVRAYTRRGKDGRGTAQSTETRSASKSSDDNSLFDSIMGGLAAGALGTSAVAPLTTNIAHAERVMATKAAKSGAKNVKEVADRIEKSVKKAVQAGKAAIGDLNLAGDAGDLAALLTGLAPKNLSPADRTKMLTQSMVGMAAYKSAVAEMKALDLVGLGKAESPATKAVLQNAYNSITAMQHGMELLRVNLAFGNKQSHSIANQLLDGVNKQADDMHKLFDRTGFKPKTNGTTKGGLVVASSFRSILNGNRVEDVTHNSVVEHTIGRAAVGAVRAINSVTDALQ